MSTSFATPASYSSHLGPFQAGGERERTQSWSGQDGSALRSPFGFALFILLNAVLFIRPAEIVPDLLDLPIYEVLILSCVVVSLPAILERVRLSSLAAQPI